MVYLIQKGLESEQAFTIMEKVRKGKGLTPEQEEVMRAHDVPDWYIWSCKKIKYMFPKAHAAAYVMMAWRVAYCKVFYPLAYYCAYFSIRANAFDYEKMAMGRDKLEYFLTDYKARKAENQLTNAEEDELKDMRIVQEMYARGFDFTPINLYQAKARSFQIIDGKIMPSFKVIDKVGEVALSSLTLFLSYNYMAAGIASTLLFVYPIMVALIMAMVFKEKLALQTIVCMLLALGGIGLLYKSEDGSTLSLIGTLLVFASSLSYAIYIVGINQTSLKNVATLKVTFYVLLFGLSLFVARLLYSGVLNTPDQWYLWANLLALAVFPTAISFLCTTGAIQYIGSTPTAILGALEPVTAIFFGIAVFGESLTVRESFGLVMIIVAVTFVIAGGNITSQLVRFRKLFPRLPIRSKKRN
jgi:drug/metabolite transporter (DMT)-like permease